MDLSHNNLLTNEKEYLTARQFSLKNTKVKLEEQKIKRQDCHLLDNLSNNFLSILFNNLLIYNIIMID